MRKLRASIRHCLTVARMGSADLAGMTLPPWLLAALRFRQDVREDYIGLIAAGVAFFFLLAAFPALGAAISIFGLFSDPHLIADQLRMLARFLPPEAFAIIMNQATRLAAAPAGTLSLSLVISVMFTLYSATRGVGALIKGFNIAYDARETRGLFHLTMLGYGLTILLLVYFLVSLLLVAGLPAAVQIFPFPQSVAEMIRWLRWPLLFIAALVGLEVLYTLGPCRRPRRIGISAGALAATLLWIAGSALFSLFVTNFGNYNEAYGSLGAVVILMLWFWMSALTILMGAEINGALEKHYRKKDGERLERVKGIEPS